VKIESTDGSILDGDTDGSLDVDVANGTLTMIAAGSIGDSGSVGLDSNSDVVDDGNNLEIEAAKINAEANGGNIGINETGDMVIDAVNAEGGDVKLMAGGTINDGSIKGGNVTIKAVTIGLTDIVTVDVGANNLYLKLTGQEGLLSGKLAPGDAFTGTPTEQNINAPGTVIIEQRITFAGGELAEIEGALAALATVSTQQEALEVLLRLAAEANFFMIPPLDLFIDMEEEEEFFEGAWLLNPGDLNVRNWTDGPTLLHSNSLTGTSPPLSLLPNGHEGQQPRLLASL